MQRNPKPTSSFNRKPDLKLNIPSDTKTKSQLSVGDLTPSSTSKKDEENEYVTELNPRKDSENILSDRTESGKLDSIRERESEHMASHRTSQPQSHRAPQNGVQQGNNSQMSLNSIQDSSKKSVSNQSLGGLRIKSSPNEDLKKKLRERSNSALGENMLKRQSSKDSVNIPKNQKKPNSPGLRRYSSKFRDSVNMTKNDSAPAMNLNVPSQTLPKKLARGRRDSVSSDKLPLKNTSQQSQLNSSQSSQKLASLIQAGMLKRDGSQQVQSSNIKVCTRFRPLNQMELDLIEDGLGENSCQFLDELSVIMKPDENHIWSFDRVFPCETTQEEVYAFLGQATIDDVLNGFNGTIFAYGQTSSGKTHTMYGDIRDPDMYGLIPRSMSQIFSYFDTTEDDVEVIVNCSMLEIYKENLYDLLNDRSSELKIKESPSKGIYVEGLAERNVIDLDETLAVLELGEKSKIMASTRMNSHSSRSHTLFILEIVQRFPNKSEKRGKLNLIDLAGSEKVGKTGATGETLEEAKKINLSLSSLGNVIHSLTINSEHIPYRDSKLTRILQESLGGNYKTSLIVCCSPHSSNREETISTLKFATRAKTIKTHYKMNVQNSPETMMIMIEQLKNQLLEAQTQIDKYKTGELDIDKNELKKFSKFKPRYPAKQALEDMDSQKEPENWNVGGISLYEPNSFVEYRGSAKKTTTAESIADRLTQSEKKHKSTHSDLSYHIPQVILNNLQQSGDFDNALRADFIQVDKINQLAERDKTLRKHYKNYSYYKTNLELLHQNEILETRVQNLKNDLGDALTRIDEKNDKIKKQDEEIHTLRHAMLQLENKYNVLSEEKSRLELKESSSNKNIDQFVETIQVLEREVKVLSDALIQNEETVEKLLNEKAKLTNQKFNDLAKEDIQLAQINLSKYVSSAVNFSFQPFYNRIENKKDKQGSQVSIEELNNEDGEPTRTVKPLHHESFISQLNLEDAFQSASENIKKLLNIKDILSPITKLIESSGGDMFFQENPINHKLKIYVLQNQLIQSMIVNHHLQRVISTLEWKQIIEFAKARIKSSYTKLQDQQIANMEKVLDKSAISHQKLRNRIEAIEMGALKFRDRGSFEGTRSPPHKQAPQPQPAFRRLTTDKSVHIAPSANPQGPHKAKLLRQVTRKETKHATMIRAGPKTEHSIRLPTESKDRIETDNSNPDGFQTRNHLTNSSFVQPESTQQFIKEIEKEMSMTSKNPGSLIEATMYLNLKNQIIEKMFKFIQFGPPTQVNPATSYQQIDQIQQPSQMSQFNSNEVEYLRTENERLEHNILSLQSELELEKTRTTQLRDAYHNCYKQMEELRNLNHEIETANKNSLKQENESWQTIVDELQTTFQEEIVRKHNEVKKLYDLLAGWVYKFMEIQEKHEVNPNHYEKTLYEAFIRKEIPDVSIIEKALKQKPAIQPGKSSPAKVSHSHQNSSTKKSISGPSSARKTYMLSARSHH